MARGLRPTRRTGLGPRERRHDLQRPVDVEAVHGDGGHAGGRSGWLDLDEPITTLSPWLHRPQRLRGAPGAEDHAADAPEPHRRLHARGSAWEQQRARPGRLRRPRSQHLPDRGCAFRSAPGTRTRISASTSPASCSSASRASRSRRSCATPCSSRSAWSAAPLTGGDPVKREPRPRARRALSRPACRRGDDGGRRPLRERRRPGAVPPLPAERRLDRRPRRARFEVARGDADGAAVARRRAAGYALGVVRHRWDTWPDLLEHGGGGYGFLSDLWWVPEVGIGVAVLTNSDDHQLQNELATSILADLLREPGTYRDRLPALPWRAPVEDPNVSFAPPAGLASLVADAAMPARGDGGDPLGRLLRALPNARVGRASNWKARRPASSSTRASPTSRAKTGTTCSPAIASPRSSPACSWPTTARRWTSGDPFRPGGTSGSFASRTAPLHGSGRSSGRPRSSRSPGSAARWPWTVRRSPASRTATSRWRGVAAAVAGATGAGRGRSRGTGRVAARAGRRRLPRLAELPPAERLALHLPLAVAVLGASHGRACRGGLDRTLVAARGQAAVRRRSRSRRLRSVRYSPGGTSSGGA